MGVLGKPVGLAGEITLRTGPDFWAAALESRRLRIVSAGTQTPATVERARERGPGAAVVKLLGVEDRNAAQALVGMQLVLPVAGMDVRPPEEWRPFQLLGLQVVTVQGEQVGAVIGVEPMPAQDLLIVRGPRGEHRVPLVPAIVRAIDPAAGTVTIDPPAGLLEL